jgi:hypothetical protein
LGVVGPPRVAVVVGVGEIFKVVVEVGSGLAELVVDVAGREEVLVVGGGDEVVDSGVVVLLEPVEVVNGLGVELFDAVVILVVELDAAAAAVDGGWPVVVTAAELVVGLGAVELAVVDADVCAAVVRVVDVVDVGVVVVVVAAFVVVIVAFFVPGSSSGNVT